MTVSAKSTAKRRKAFLEIFKAKAGNISVACEAAHIDRGTYYKWREKYPSFDRACAEIKESLLDYAESKLMQNIQNGYFPAIAYFLDRQGKDRGYAPTINQKTELSGPNGASLAPPIINVNFVKAENRQLQQGESEAIALPVCERITDD